jgi:hypothetical protein
MAPYDYLQLMKNFFRYQYQPSNILKSLTTSITLCHFLLHDDLVPIEKVAETIGSEFMSGQLTAPDYIRCRSVLNLTRFLMIFTVKPEWSDRIQLSPDDYLQGVIGASNELVSLATPLPCVTIFKALFPFKQARLAMNSVTLQNFALPLRRASFEKDLFAGFSLASSAVWI